MPDKNLPSSAKIAELTRRLDKQPESRVFLELAREYHEAGELERAATICSTGIGRHPSYLSARVLMGRICFEMGRTEEARKEMEGVLAKAPDNLMAWRVLAQIALEDGDPEGALERFRILLAFSPDDEEVQERIHEIDAQLSGEASTDTEAARPAGSDTGRGALATPTLAELFLQQGLTEKAAEVYREILAGDPSNQEVRTRLEEIEASAEPFDPAMAKSRRKVEKLRSWLETIKKGDGE